MFLTKVRHPIAGEHAAAISDLAERLASEYAGQGQTETRTYLDDEVVTVVLRVVLTEGELRLVREGKSDLVVNTRLAFQLTMREHLVAGIEEITGRKVRVSANHMESDIAVETFVLEERTGKLAVRAEKRPRIAGPKPASSLW
jgi:uncharacterized protein YbcI